MSDQNPFTASKLPFAMLVSVALAFVLSLVLMFVLELSVVLGLFAAAMILIVAFALMIYFLGEDETVPRPVARPATSHSDTPAEEPEVAVAEPAVEPVAEPADVPEPRAAEEEVAPVADAAPAPVTEDDRADAGKPTGFEVARETGADNLKLIKGVGPKLEALLNSMGFWHFDQIAAWSEAEIAWVDANLEGFRGRVTRDEWVSQAKILAEGGETEFSARKG